MYQSRPNGLAAKLEEIAEAARAEVKTAEVKEMAANMNHYPYRMTPREAARYFHTLAETEISAETLDALEALPEIDHMRRAWSGLTGEEKCTGQIFTPRHYTAALATLQRCNLDK